MDIKARWYDLTPATKIDSYIQNPVLEYNGAPVTYNSFVEYKDCEYIRVFNQYNGSCWINSALTLLFFDDNLQKTTWRLFKYGRLMEIDYFVPLEIIVKITNHPILDLSLSLIIEYVRKSLEITLLSSYTRENIISLSRQESLETANKGFGDYLNNFLK